MAKLIETKYPDSPHGFYGTLHNYSYWVPPAGAEGLPWTTSDAALAFDAWARKLVKYGLTVGGARDLLDSTLGRHLADTLVGKSPAQVAEAPVPDWLAKSLPNPSGQPPVAPRVAEQPVDADAKRQARALRNALEALEALIPLARPAARKHCRTKRLVGAVCDPAAQLCEPCQAKAAVALAEGLVREAQWEAQMQKPNFAKAVETVLGQQQGRG